MIPNGDRTRMLQCLELTSSSAEGEALAAIRAAWRLAQKHGLTLPEALQSNAVVLAQQIDLQRLAQLEGAAFERGRQAGLAEAETRALPPWRVLRQRCLAEVPDLRQREREFLVDIEHRRALSEKQTNWLASIFARRVTP